MQLHKITYFFYRSVRTFVRASGLAKPARSLLGPMAGRLVFKSSVNADRPLLIQGHQMFLAPKGSYASPDMVVDRYERATTELFKEVLQPGMVFVDVGANIGYFSLLAAKLVGPDGKVYAFEPEPGNHGLLRKNIELNSYSNVQTIQKAVSDKSESTLLFLSALDTGSHSLYSEAARGKQESVEITTTSIDEFLESEGWPGIDLMKIDVEGAELGVLEGMGSLVERFPALKLIVEYCPFLIQSTGANPSDLLTKLTSLGFRIEIIDDKKGVVPLDISELTSITDILLKQETYINILCSHT
jgi:FkbM family methyltransferase